MPPSTTDARSVPPLEDLTASRSRSGVLVLLGALVVGGLGGGALLMARRPSAPPAPAAAIRGAYEQVELGTFRREILVDAASLVRESFEVRVSLLLNPEYGDLAAYRPLVEKRRDLLRHIVWTEIILPKSDPDLRKPTVLDGLSQEIRARLNAELGPSPAGQELVRKVIFPDSKLPVRR